jgi:hypothetical protein
MANELTAVASLTGSKNGITVTGTCTKTYSLSGDQLWANVQDIGIGGEQISFPADLTTEGITYIWVKNLDPANYVDIALDGSYTQIFAKLTFGQTMVFPPYTGNPTYYARANTAQVSIQLVAVGT